MFSENHTKKVFVFIATIFFLKQVAAQSYLNGCNFPSGYTLQDGFDLNFYYAPYYVYSNYFTSDYLEYGYSTYQYYGQGTGVETMSYTNNWPDSQPFTTFPSYFNYKGIDGYDNRQFQFDGRGYFYAPVSGVYKFNVGYADNYSYLMLGSGNAFSCCQQKNSLGGGNIAGESVGKIWGDYDDTDAINAELEFYLLEGNYYPIRILYLNTGNGASFNFEFSTPDNPTFRSVYTGYVFSSTYELDYVCDNPIVSQSVPWLSSYVSTFTTNTETVFTTQNLITTKFLVEEIVYTPKPTTLTSVTTETTTGIDAISTVSLTLNITNTVNDQVTVFIDETVEIPITFDFSTSYRTYGGLNTSTYSLTARTSTAPNGMIIVSTIYFVNTPVVNVTSTHMTPAFVSDTVTYSTGFVTTTGKDGIQTDLSIYYVQTPIVTAETTSYASYNGTGITTYTTDFFTTTVNNSKETVSTIFHVYTPKHVSTEYTGYSGLTPTTYSTGYFTTTGNNSIPTTSTTYYVYTPTNSNVPTTSRTDSTLSKVYAVSSTMITNSSIASNFTSNYVQTPFTSSKVAYHNSTLTNTESSSVSAVAKSTFALSTSSELLSDTASHSTIKSTLNGPTTISPLKSLSSNLSVTPTSTTSNSVEPNTCSNSKSSSFNQYESTQSGRSKFNSSNGSESSSSYSKASLTILSQGPSSTLEIATETVGAASSLFSTQNKFTLFISFILGVLAFI